jgi:hypothetical protein
LLLSINNIVFADLPVISELRGENVLGPSAIAEGTSVASFFITGDGETTFRLQIIFKNCRKLKDLRSGYFLPLASIKLKYKNAPNGSKEWDLSTIPANGLNCHYIIDSFNPVQKEYDMELLVSWSGKKTTAGTFSGTASFEILP